ncbi:MAG: hypothetical protein E7031_06280 [Akkermansiaceae bacterium]|nr:hypothetical protein [Akkermansiaceae bacterium]
MILIPIMGGLWVWHYVGILAEPVLHPINEEFQGLSTIPEQHVGMRLTPLTFQGWDGAEIPAVLVEKAEEDSARQRAVRAELTEEHIRKLQNIDYAIVCVEWDHGIQSALPLADYLTGAGIPCILWEPRGKDNARQYCTHGLQESDDVPLLINQLVIRSGKERPLIIAVGQGFGADLLLQAAAKDDRIRGIVAIDALASLRESISRTMPDNLVSKVKLALMDARINKEQGFECFDVAPVESATNINRDTPALIVYLQQDPHIRTINDALSIYRQLPSDTKEVWALTTAQDPPGATTRIQHCTVGEGENERTYDIELQLKNGPESAYMDIIFWLHNQFLTAIDKPHVSTPNRPILTPRSQL